MFVCLVILHNLRWRLIDDGYGLELHSPQFQNRRVKGNESIQQYKKTIRDELRARIDEQFSSSSVRRFIRNAEQPPSMKKRKSILNLIADGHEVQKRLELARSFSKDNPNRLDKLRTAIKPYLQLVEPDVSDEFTNIPLLDIWRYFRYSWSIPQTPIPGRHLNYLVRDAAQESHAVIGIIGLSNCVVQLTPRDRAIGWTSTSLQQAITAIVRNDESTSDSSQRVKCVFDCLRSSLEFNTSHDLDRSSSLLNGIVDWLLDEVSTGIEEIESRGLLTESEILNPTREVIARLKALSREFATNRQDSLAGGSRDHKKSIETEIPLDNDLIALDSSQLSNDSGLTSRRMLIGKKRALELSKLLDSRRVLTQKRDVLVDPQRVIGDILDDEVQTAINSAMASIKSRRIGTNMLEITTCGAVTPYNTMLGGKLVALLTLSPQVSVDYQRKYGSEPTIIRSQLKNRTVVTGQ